MESNLHYPNLINITVDLKAPGTNSAEPVFLQQSTYDALNLPIPTPYDFALEKSAMKKKNGSSSKPRSEKEQKEELERSILARMKSATQGDEDVCIAMLNQNSYNLEASIEAFFQSENR